MAKPTRESFQNFLWHSISLCNFQLKQPEQFDAVSFRLNFSFDLTFLIKLNERRRRRRRIVETSRMCA